jgi:hypothetical protein
MATRPQVILIDDGELDDVRELLGVLGANFVHLRGGSVPAAVEPATPDDRRKHERVPYRREIVSIDQEAEAVLMGRDLSLGGMRVDPHPGVKVGDLLRLAIYGSPREEPFVVHAHVVRREADGGFGLKFEQLGPNLSARLESVVARLPAVESLEQEEADRLGSVVSRILEWEDSPEQNADAKPAGPAQP